MNHNDNLAKDLDTPSKTHDKDIDTVQLSSKVNGDQDNLHRPVCNEKGQEGTLPTGRKKRKFSPLSLAITGGMLVALLVNYLIATPSNPLMFISWIISVLIPYAAVFALLRFRTPFTKLIYSKTGGIILLILFTALNLLVPLLYTWLSLLFIFGGGLLLILTIANIMPSTYIVTLEEADGTTRTETHILGDNPDSDIARIESDYKNQGYTKK